MARRLNFIQSRLKYMADKDKSSNAWDDLESTVGIPLTMVENVLGSVIDIFLPGGNSSKDSDKDSDKK
jgi:hypothetical protein